MPKRTFKVFNLEGKPAGKIDTPAVFGTPVRPDIIRRTVLAAQSNVFQPQGRDPMAGKRTSAESRGTGLAMARIPRSKGPGGRAAFAPGTVGGRQGHPASSEKRIAWNMPQKERRLGLLSAIAATASKDRVISRGHSVMDVLQIPLVVVNDLEELDKTAEVEQALVRLGVLSDIYRAKESRKIRAGKGKRRGRKMKRAVGPLIVVAEDKGIFRGARNIPGVDVATVQGLSATMLAPGAVPGRFTIWTAGAIGKLDEIFGKEGTS